MSSFNPFIPFTTLYLERCQKKGTNFFVTQTYTRGTDHFADHAKVNLLVTEYEDYGLAVGHLRAVKGDEYGAVIDITKEAHLNKFIEMLSTDSNYQLWWSVVQDRERTEAKLNKKYIDNMRRYLQQHTDWRIAAEEKIKPKLEVIFGELFLTLKRGSHQLRVKFEEIERA